MLAVTTLPCSLASTSQPPLHGTNTSGSSNTFSPTFPSNLGVIINSHFIGILWLSYISNCLLQSCLYLHNCPIMKLFLIKNVCIYFLKWFNLSFLEKNFLFLNKLVLILAWLLRKLKMLFANGMLSIFWANKSTQKLYNSHEVNSHKWFHLYSTLYLPRLFKYLSFLTCCCASLALKSFRKDSGEAFTKVLETGLISL